MIECIAFLHERVVNNPCCVQNAEQELKHVTQSWDRMVKASCGRIGTGSARFTRFETINGRKDEVERDEGKCHPLDDDLFSMSWK